MLGATRGPGRGDSHRLTEARVSTHLGDRLPFAPLSTSSPGRHSLFFPKSGPTDFGAAPRNPSGLLWANSKDEDEGEDSVAGAEPSPSGSMLPPVSQWQEPLPPANRRDRRVRAVGTRRGHATREQRPPPGSSDQDGSRPGPRGKTRAAGSRVLNVRSGRHVTCS